MTLESRCQAVNLILREKVTIEDDISIFIGKLAIQITLVREQEILSESTII